MQEASEPFRGAGGGMKGAEFPTGERSRLFGAQGVQTPQPQCFDKGKAMGSQNAVGTQANSRLTTAQKSLEVPPGAFPKACDLQPGMCIVHICVRRGKTDSRTRPPLHTQIWEHSRLLCRVVSCLTPPVRFPHPSSPPLPFLVYCSPGWPQTLHPPASAS